MKLFFKILLIFLFSLSCYAESVSQYISNLIPGEGDTEVSIDLRDNHKPDYSILAVREIEKTETGNYFTQMSLFNTEKNNDERVVGHIYEIFLQEPLVYRLLKVRKEDFLLKH